MTQNSYPKAAVEDEGLSDHHWKHLMLPSGRGVIDRGGFPYRLTARDSVTNTVTIGVDTREGENFALLDGFLHHMDAPESISVPPVTSDTVYEIGLEYDPQAHAAENGPVTLKAWTAPADTSQNKSHLVLYRMTRKANLALGSTPYEEERPRAVPVFSVSKKSSLPKNSLVLVDSLGIVRTENTLYRADIAENGVITWSALGGNSGEGLTDSRLQALKDKVDAATWDSIGSTLMWRGWDGVARVKGSTAHPENILNVGTGDGRYSRPGHTHPGSEITSRVPFEHVDGSTAAYSNTNLGSTWTTPAVNSQGFLGRYPSALKYKRNIRAWNPDPRKVLALEPVQYDVRTDVAGASESSDKGLIGFVADSYVETLRELVLMMDGEVEGFHYHLVGVAQQVVLRYLDKRVTTLETENERLRHNQAAIIAHLGLDTDAAGRVITTENGA